MYQEVCFNRGTEAGGGVNMGHSLSPPPQSFYACYGPEQVLNNIQMNGNGSRPIKLFSATLILRFSVSQTN